MNRKKYAEDLAKAGSFFYAYKQGRVIKMDLKKLFDKVLENEDVQGIPLIFVFAIMNSVIEAISSGECFLSTEYD